MYNFICIREKDIGRERKRASGRHKANLIKVDIFFEGERALLLMQAGRRWFVAFIYYSS